MIKECQWPIIFRAALFCSCPKEQPIIYIIYMYIFFIYFICFLCPTGQCPRLWYEWKNKMNLKFICFHKQHLFQIRSPLEWVLLTREKHMGVRLCRLWESIQKSRILEKGFFCLLHIMLKLLVEKKWSKHTSSAFYNMNPHHLGLHQHWGEFLP